MIFTIDKNRAKIEIKNRNKLLFIMFPILFIIAMLQFSLYIKGKSILFIVIPITLVFSSLAALVGLSIGKKRLFKQINSYKLIIEDNVVEKYQHGFSNIKIENNNILKITKDKRGKIYIYLKNNKLGLIIPKTISEPEKLNAELNKISKIEEKIQSPINKILKFVPYLSLVFFIILRFITNISIYFYFGSITIIFMLITSLLVFTSKEIDKNTKIITAIIYCFILYRIFNNVLYAFNAIFM